MDLSLSEQQEMLLYKALKDHQGTLPVRMARDMYSSKSSAHSALDKLKLAGFIDFKTPGYFKVVKIPHGVKKELPEDIREKLDDSGNKKEYESETEKSVEVP